MIHADGMNDNIRTADPLWAHCVPFVAWLAFMLLPDVAPPGWMYALRTVACAGLLLAFRPWRWYARLNVRNLPLALTVGIGVCVVWVLPESQWMREHAPALQQLYLRVGTLWPWALPPAVTETPYAPAICGWSLTITRLLGSTLVIAVIEEFFWRGCLYRLLVQRDFVRVSLGTFHASSFWITALLFGLEHDRWLVGLIAGLVYGWLLLRTRDIWSVAIAHGITNLLLGIYVITTGAWAFW